MSNYLEPSYWSELCLARHYVKLSHPVFRVMSKACLQCEKYCSKKCYIIIVLNLWNVAVVTVYSWNLMLLVVGEKHCEQLKNISIEYMWDIYIYIFFFLSIFMGFCVYVPLPPLRGQHTVLCHPRWLPTSGLTEFAVCWGGAGFEPRTTDLQSGALPLSHLSSSRYIYLYTYYIYIHIIFLLYLGYH